MDNSSFAVKLPHPSSSVEGEIIFSREAPDDDEKIEELNRQAFGPARFTRAAHLIREHGGHDPALSFVARLGDKLVGTIRMTPIVVGQARGYLLGPIVVSPDLKSLGLGARLMKLAIDAAKAENAHFILLVGDEPYYRRFGFSQVPKGSVKMPAPVNPARLLAHEFVEGTMASLKGEVRHKNQSKPSL